jgi:hypothetical protein
MIHKTACLCLFTKFLFTSKVVKVIYVHCILVTRNVAHCNLLWTRLTVSLIICRPDAIFCWPWLYTEFPKFSVQFSSQWNKWQGNTCMVLSCLIEAVFVFAQLFCVPMSAYKRLSNSFMLDFVCNKYLCLFLALHNAPLPI